MGKQTISAVVVSLTALSVIAQADRRMMAVIMALFFLGIAFTAVIAALAIHPDHAGAKSEYALWTIAIICTLIAGGIVLKDWRKSERAKQTRNRLTVYAHYGHGIISQCHFAEPRRHPAPDDWAEAWGRAITEFVESELGEDYAVRFNSGAGLPTGMIVLEPPYSRVESFVRARIARLTEFMQELANKNR